MTWLLIAMTTTFLGPQLMQAPTIYQVSSLETCRFVERTNRGFHCLQVTDQEAKQLKLIVLRSVKCSG